MERFQYENEAQYLFHEGTYYHAYQYFGCHETENGFVFRVYAPNAKGVSLVGDWNHWDEKMNPMIQIGDGIWECETSFAKENQNYKYLLQTHEEKRIYKSDPYGIQMETPPNNASKVKTLQTYPWNDKGWLAYRNKHFCKDAMEHQPINVYELHVGSWKRHTDGRFLNYVELAHELASYVKQMGYTHVELLPIMEHSFDGSWGYQISGYYSVTSRFGTPEQFMEFVDILHGAGIGVILDWVPGHFSKDENGLANFDGEPLYEYENKLMQEHPVWGTRYFNLGKNEVISYLISNAIFWLKEFHIDGLRIDAVASMIYLDFDKTPGQWLPSEKGDNINRDAIAFLKKCNDCIHKLYPDVMTIAEDSSTYAGVTSEEGLHFSWKWNMGWMHDTFTYLQNRNNGIKGKDLLYPCTYQYGERYILPISHDEVVYGKRSLMNRFVGDYEQRFAQYRLFLLYLISIPGKKTLFSGCEIAQFDEWSHDAEIQWFLLDYEMHRKMQLFVSELNHFYLQHSELFELDEEPSGFEVLEGNKENSEIYVFKRKNKLGKELIFALNANNEERKIQINKNYKIVFCTDEIKYGGKTKIEKINHRKENTISAFCGIVYHMK